jgi:hypothetical protein
MHEYVVKRDEKGLYSIRSVDFDGIIYNAFDVHKENLEKEMEKIRRAISSRWDTDTYTAKVNFRFYENNA